MTTFSKPDEDRAIAAVDADRPKQQAQGVRVGLASVDPTTGGILAMYGGSSYGRPQYVNDASQSTVQAGSTFKAFTLVAALEHGIGLDSTWDSDSGRTFVDSQGYRTGAIANKDDASYGSLTLKEATARSVNTAFVDVTNHVGARAVVAAARATGIPSSVPLTQRLSVTLGVDSPTVLDMASAYATFAAGGRYLPPFSIARVTAADGRSLTRPRAKPTREMPADIAAQVTEALEGVITDPNGTGTRAQAVGRPAAGKTGTTNGNLAAWFVGYTPQLSTAVALFRLSSDGRTELTLDGVDGNAHVEGADYPTSIWTDYTIQALRGLPVAQFTPATSRVPAGHTWSPAEGRSWRSAPTRTRTSPDPTPPASAAAAGPGTAEPGTKLSPGRIVVAPGPTPSPSPSPSERAPPSPTPRATARHLGTFSR